jgi:hypothetical protein
MLILHSLAAGISSPPSLNFKSKLLLLIEAAKVFFNGLLNHLVNNAMFAAKGP